LCEVHPRQLLPNETPRGILRRITEAGLSVAARCRYENVHYVLAIRY
jgi:hypothetical protein